MPGLTNRPRTRLLLSASAAVVAALAIGLLSAHARGQSAADPPPESDRVTISADYCQQWQLEQESVSVLRGHCRIVRGPTVLRSRKMVIWQRPATPGRDEHSRLAVYLEGEARIDRPGSSLSEATMFVELLTESKVETDYRRRVDGRPQTKDSLYLRANQRRATSGRSALLATQMVVPDEDEPGREFRVVQVQQPSGDLRRVRTFPRSAIPFNVESFRSSTTPPEQIWVLRGGINVLIDGVSVENIEDLGTVDLSADRMVIWTQTGATDEFQPEALQSRDEPFTVYMEGNIVIRQGRNVLRASHAVYDAREERALLLNADLHSFIPRLNGNIRVRADRIRQLSQNRFHASNAWTTTSTFGKPGYRVQASDVFLENRVAQPVFGGRPPALDPVTGVPVLEETPYVTSLNNTLFVDDVPLFFIPLISAPADDPDIPLRRATARQDSIFGAQIETVWNAFQLFGIEEPSGVEWDLLVDLYSKRGPAFGTAGEYRGTDLFGIPGTYSGEGLIFYVNDDGEDNLGADRRSVEPETNDRYRALLRHRQDMPGSLTVIGELGLLSDRNFLEQYYENEFDEEKDNETLLYAKQQADNWAWSILGRLRPNDFATTTEWLPRGDLYALSEPLLGGLLTWSMHSSAGFGKLRPGAGPTDPTEVFTPLPFVSDVDGAVLMTRHELDMPFSLGPLRVAPYALGEGAFWSEDFTRDELDRLVGSAGVRSSLLVWRVFPYVQSRVFNLNGLAHKMLFEVDYSATDATTDLSDIPQYNEFDDNAQERFRQRLVTNTFGGVLPPVFEPRFYAVRAGAGSSVTAPYHELIDDQQVARLAWRHRLQTKSGPPEALQIKDWMTLDLEASFFPNENRDNFGEDFGLLGARYVWHIGDRTRVLADARYDTFDNAPELWNVAVLSQRSERGSIYTGVRQVKGAGLDSQILTVSYTYKMSPKWVSTFGTAFDLGENENRGQSLTITRIGADFLVHVGANFDQSKDNAGIAVSVEPRFFGQLNGSSTQLSSLLGLQ